MNKQIHPSAVIDQGAIIGNGTRIWHFCHIMSTAVLGEGCTLGQNVFVGEKVHIGNNVKIQNNVSIYQGVTLEDEVFIGPSAVFTNVLTPRAFIERKKEFLLTHVSRGASIGANATILCGIRIGAYAMIGAGCVVTKDIPDYALVRGNPGKVVGKVDRSGRTIQTEDE